MKLFGSIPQIGSSGSVRLEIEESEDLWHLYNIVESSDHIRARTKRKVKLESASGNVNVQVKKLTITIELTTVDYEPSDKVIRCSGKCLTDCEEIRLGQFHTIELSQHDSLTLEKNEWRFNHTSKLHEATDTKASADCAAILIDQGNAQLFLMTSSMVKDCGKLTSNLAKKTVRNTAHGKIDKQKKRYYDGIIIAMRNHFEFSNLKCIILGGPAPIRDEFYQYLFEECVRRQLTEISSRQKLFIKATSTSVTKNSLTELLLQPEISEKIKDTKAIGELAAIQNFHKQQQDDPLRAAYGIAGVSLAAEMGAIQGLIISEELFRSDKLSYRKHFSKMAQAVEQAGGKVWIISTLSLCNEQIKNLASIAAILRYPVHELEDLDHGKLPDDLA